MKKTGIGLLVGFAALIGTTLAIAAHELAKLSKLDIGDVDIDEMAFNEHEIKEIEEGMDSQDGVLPVSLRSIHLGDLTVPCPVCDTPVDEISFGLGTAEDRDSSEGEFNDLKSLGFIVYSCGHVIFSPCLSDKVANILNAEENHSLVPSMLENLAHCEEHGNGQS